MYWPILSLDVLKFSTERIHLRTLADVVTDREIGLSWQATKMGDWRTRHTAALELPKTKDALCKDFDLP